MGTRLAKEHVRVIGWPAGSQVDGAFATADDVLNRGLIQTVYQNEPITEGKLAPIEAGAGLPPSITPGMRALSVRVNEVIGVAGFTVPGTRVDVLVTLKDGDNSLTRAVVSNISVLTAGTRYDVEQGKAGNAMPSSVVTLLVTPEDAERITLAQSTGAIMLVLRNPLDVAPTRSLTGAPAPAPVIKADNRGQRRAVTPKPVAPAVPPSQPIEIYRAGKRTEVVSNGGGKGDK
jgi:pilus assembly protein CpaB